MDVRRFIRFYLNGTLCEVAPVSATQTVLQYLREELKLTGTKEGCNEGDCGACTVTEASLGPDGQVSFQAINACIRFLPTLDGKAIWTVEALEQDGAPHPVQQAMIDYHGSQCGFCTPGFIMSMYTMYQNGKVRPVREEVLDALSGNLCRCTGYRPIIDAACNMDAYPAVSLDREALREQLLALRQSSGGMLAFEAGGQSYFAPTHADELAELYERYPDAVVLAGGTDVGLWVTKQLKTLPVVIYLGDIAELDYIESRDGVLNIGAVVSLNEGYEAITEQYPEIRELWKRFASTPIRNSGTLVGNLANGSPIGDTAPLLIAIGSTVVLRKGARRRRLPLEDLYLDYRKQDREPGEFVESVMVPLRDPECQVASYKLSKRIDQDISAVCSAYAIKLDQGKVASVRIAHGGMAATSRRARRAEHALLGRDWTEATVAEAMRALDDDYQPMTDMRASDDYRRKSARNLLYRFYLESTGQADARIPGF
ncbi:xanthine dehydrogenase small subunit [Pusillimonas sp.]|uniref:xanthine dehydrogenase small subunit n=1 Tax=Pusillimonas sp. TaxID=3040095 RepID=UPI0037C70BD4